MELQPDLLLRCTRKGPCDEVLHYDAKNQLLNAYKTSVPSVAKPCLERPVRLALASDKSPVICCLAMRSQPAEPGVFVLAAGLSGLISYGSCIKVISFITHVNEYVSLMNIKFELPLPTQQITLKRANNTQPSPLFTVYEIFWAPNSGTSIAARMSIGGSSVNLFIWETEKPEAPKQFFADENVNCTSICWATESQLYVGLLHGNKGIASLKRITFRCSVSSSRRSELHNMEDPSIDDISPQKHFTKHTPITCINVDPGGRFIAYLLDQQVFVSESANVVYKVRMDGSRVGIQWNPCIRSQLALYNDINSSICLIDLFFADPGGGSVVPPLERHVSTEQLAGASGVKCMSWLPSMSDYLLVCVNSGVQLVKIPTNLYPVGFDDQCHLTICKSYKISSASTTDDISTRMHMRASVDYKVSTDDQSHHGTSLTRHWQQLESLKKIKFNSKSNERLFGADNRNVGGIWGVCDLISGCSSSSPSDKSCYTTPLPPVKLLTNELGNTLYTSFQRKSALRFCGWHFFHSSDYDSTDLENFVEATGRSASAGAALALFSGRFRRCLTYLDDIKDSGFALALTGYSVDSSEWRERCMALRVRDPYLKAMFGFLADPFNPEDVLRRDLHPETGFPCMHLEDHVAFACLLLPDTDLSKYLEALAAKFSQRGELSGCLLTGVGVRSVQLLANYVDRTCDVQTAVLTVLESGLRLNTLPPLENSMVNDWFEQYRSLLDSWKLFEIRAHFDIKMKAIARDCVAGSVNRQVNACCSFCNKPIIANTRPTRGKRPLLLQQDREKMIHTCPNCPNSLPRCCVCLQLLGTSSGRSAAATAAGGASPSSAAQAMLKPAAAMSGGGGRVSGGGRDRTGVRSGEARQKLNELGGWFSWCNSCSHGGHALHLFQWFQSGQLYCPVEKCRCRCGLLASG